MSLRDDDEIMHASGTDAFRPEWDANGHVTEESIHAWLDGAFGDSDSAAVERHVANCAQCSEAVAEARGYIARAARIVGALDAVPRNVVPHADVARTAARIVAASDARDARDVVSIDEKRASSSRLKKPWYAQSAFRAAAAVVVMIGGASFVMRESRAVPIAVPSASATSAATVAQSAMESRVAFDRAPSSGSAVAARVPLGGAPPNAEVSKPAPSQELPKKTSATRNELPQAPTQTLAAETKATSRTAMSGALASASPAERTASKLVASAADRSAPALAAAPAPPMASPTPVAAAPVLAPATALQRRAASAMSVMAAPRPSAKADAKEISVATNSDSTSSDKSVADINAYIPISAEMLRAVSCLQRENTAASPELPLIQTLRTVPTAGGLHTFAAPAWPTDDVTTSANFSLQSNGMLYGVLRHGGETLAIELRALVSDRWAGTLTETRGGNVRTQRLIFTVLPSEAACSAR
jgi:hypothetical protein